MANTSKQTPVEALQAEVVGLRAQLWEALSTTLVSFPEQLHDAQDRTKAGQELRTILTRHLRSDEDVTES